MERVPEIAAATASTWAACVGWMLGTALTRYPKRFRRLGLQLRIIDIHYREPMSLKTAQECERTIIDLWPSAEVDYPTIKQFFST